MSLVDACCAAPPSAYHRQMNSRVTHVCLPSSQASCGPSQLPACPVIRQARCPTGPRPDRPIPALSPRCLRAATVAVSPKPRPPRSPKRPIRPTPARHPVSGPSSAAHTSSASVGGAAPQTAGRRTRSGSLPSRRWPGARTQTHHAGPYPSAQSERPSMGGRKRGRLACAWRNDV